MMGGMAPAPLARLLLDRFRWFDEALLEALRERLGHDITSAQSLLFADLPFEGARQADLARQLGVSRQAVNELVRGLQRQGLVEFDADPGDRRAKIVRPTAAGRRSIAVADEVFADLERGLEARLGSVDLVRLRTILTDDRGAATLLSEAVPAALSDRLADPALRSGGGDGDP